MRTTTIKFSLTEDLRTTPELLCKSKDKVPLFKLTASGSYNCTRNAFRRAGFKQTKSNNFTVLWGMPLKLCERKELRELPVTQAAALQALGDPSQFCSDIQAHLSGTCHLCGRAAHQAASCPRLSSKNTKKAASGTREAARLP